MENFTVLLSYGSSTLLLLCGCICIWRAMRMEAQSKTNKDALARLIFQETESLSTKIEKQGHKIESAELRLTRHLQKLSDQMPTPATVPVTVRDQAEIAHQKIIQDWFDWDKQNTTQNQDREAA